MNWTAIVAYVTTSSWFKKWSGVLGGFILGVLCMSRFHHQIHQTIAVWGVDTGDLTKGLWAIFAASSIGLSAAATRAKMRSQTAQAAAGETIQPERQPVPDIALKPAPEAKT